MHKTTLPEFLQAELEQARAQRETPQVLAFDTRTKFWVSDPPATYEDGDSTYVLVFSERRKLLDYYQAQGFEVHRNKLLQRRMGKLRRDVPWLNWQGIMLDPDPAGGACTLVTIESMGKPEAE